MDRAPEIRNSEAEASRVVRAKRRKQFCRVVTVGDGRGGSIVELKMATWKLDTSRDWD